MKLVMEIFCLSDTPRYVHRLEISEVTWLYRCLIENGLWGRSGDLGIIGHAGACWERALCSGDCKLGEVNGILPRDDLSITRTMALSYSEWLESEEGNRKQQGNCLIHRWHLAFILVIEVFVSLGYKVASSTAWNTTEHIQAFTSNVFWKISLRYKHMVCTFHSKTTSVMWIFFCLTKSILDHIAEKEAAQLLRGIFWLTCC